MRRGRPPVGRDQSEDRIDRLERIVEGLVGELRQARQQNIGTTSTQAEQTDGRRVDPPPPPPVQQVPPPPALYGDGTLTLIKEFKKMQPPTFQGGIEPMKAEAWVLEMEKLFEVFPSTDAQKVSLAAFTLEDDARRWWMMIRESNPELTWARFLELFYNKHFPLSVRNRKATEFQTLTQGNKTVAEYDRAFTELARYAPHMANDEYMKARKFESGLRGPIQDRVNLFNTPTYAGVLDKAILAEANLNRGQSSGGNQKKRPTYDDRKERADLNDAEEKTELDNPNNVNQEGDIRPKCARCGKQHFGVCHWVTGACFECGEMGHRIKDCPKAKAGKDK